MIVDYLRRLALLLPPPSARTNGAPLVRAEGGGSKTRQNRLVVASPSFHRHRAGGDVKKAILKHALRVTYGALRHPESNKKRWVFTLQRAFISPT
jgi:hypothetical protein